MEITETTCKTMRFSGIYGLYVNKSVKKTNKGRFGYWRPWVRVPPLRPKRPFLTVFFHFVEGGAGSKPPRTTLPLLFPRDLMMLVRTPPMCELGSYIPLGDRQARLPGGEWGYIRLCRKSRRFDQKTTENKPF